METKPSNDSRPEETEDILQSQPADTGDQIESTDTETLNPAGTEPVSAGTPEETAAMPAEDAPAAEALAEDPLADTLPATEAESASPEPEPEASQAIMEAGEQVQDIQEQVEAEAHTAEPVLEADQASPEPEPEASQPMMEASEQEQDIQEQVEAEVLTAEPSEEAETIAEVPGTEIMPEPVLPDEPVTETTVHEALNPDIEPGQPVAAIAEAEQPVAEVAEAIEEVSTETEVTERVADSPAEVHEESEAEEEEAETAEAAGDFEHLSREQLIAALEQHLEAEDVNTVKTQLALIKGAFLRLTKTDHQQQLEAFLATGGKREEFQAGEDSLESRFNELFNIYKAKKQKYTEALEHQKEKNLAAKQQILEELKVLINSEETLKRTYDEFKILQEKWKEIGMVPKNDANTLWQNYHFLVEKFFDKVKINKELKDLDLRKNLELKIAICEKAEALLLEPSILKSFKQLQQYHDEWKEIGPVSLDKKDEIWERFKDATDKINERRREYYDQIREEQESNLMAKNALIDQAEKILAAETVTNKQWQETTDQLNELQKIWKTIGPAPKSANDEIWQRFKTLVDTYFANKKEFFSDIKEEQNHNYNLKLDLCAQAEAIKDSTDWKKTTQELIRLQEEWKKIGPIPRKYSEKIWKRFRAACDEFFTHKAGHFSNIQASEQDNLKKKEELIQKVAAYQFSGDKRENLEIINTFQREWMEIGFVPIREKERLQSAFRAAINEQLDRLKISATEVNALQIRNRYEHMVKDSPDAFRFLNREKNSIAQRINQIQEEINLWENNIGFLAHSQKADLLREEFEKKINKAKEEMKLLEVKLKMLKEA